MSPDRVDNAEADEDGGGGDEKLGVTLKKYKSTNRKKGIWSKK